MKKLKLGDLLALGFGFMIGSGVIALTGYGIGHTDTGILFAYPLAGIFFLFCMIPTIILGATIPRSSFSYVISKELLGPVAGGMFILLFSCGRIVMGFMGVSFANYLATIVDGVPIVPTAVIVVTIFYIIQLLGVNAVLKVQKAMNVLLFVALGTFVLFGLMKLRPDAFTAARLLPNGGMGMINAMLVIMFSMGAGLSIFEYGQDAKDKKDVFRAVMIVSFVCFVLFGLIGFAGAGVLPYETVANQPMTFAAKAIYNTAFGAMFFVIGGALMALATTINSSLNYYTQTVVKGVEDGWFPKWIAKRNKFGCPYIIMTFFWLLGILPVILGANQAFLSKIATGMAMMFFIVPNVALVKLPEKYPEEWKESRFYIKNRKVLIGLTIVCNACYVAFMCYNFYSFSPVMLAVVAALVVAFFIYCKLRVKYVDTGVSVAE